MNDAVRDMLIRSATPRTVKLEPCGDHHFGLGGMLHQPLPAPAIFIGRIFSVGGMTLLGTALQMAKAMIEDKDVVPSRVSSSDGRIGF